MLTIAAAQINASGVGGISLDAVAGAAGLSRNTLYHYVSDRAELAFLCFFETCETMLAQIAAAKAQSADPALQLSRFIEINLAKEPDRLVVLGNYDLLGDDQRTRLLESEASLHAELAEIVARGIARGRFRPVPADVAADCLLGMLNWVRVANRWLADESSDERLARAITVMMQHGIGQEASRAPTGVPDVERLLAVNFDPFDREGLKEQKRQQILAVASQLFNRRGIDGVSLNEIVAELGATKGVFYHYFKDKSDLVVQCYERAFAIYDTFVEEGARLGRSGFEKAMITNHLNCQAQFGPAPPLILQAGLETLPVSYRADFIKRSRKIWHDVQAFLAEGIEDGSCRDADVKAMTEVAAGTFAWIARKNGSSKAPTAVTIADAICDILGRGLSCYR